MAVAEHLEPIQVIAVSVELSVLEKTASKYSLQRSERTTSHTYNEVCFKECALDSMS